MCYLFGDPSMIQPVAAGDPRDPAGDVRSFSDGPSELEAEFNGG